MNLSRQALFVVAGTLLAVASIRASGQTVTPLNPSVDMGSANVCSSGQTSPAPCSQTAAVTFKFTAGGTIGKPAVVTQGAPNLDFTDANTGTCTTNGTSHTYAQGATCTVDVTFRPKYAGSRYGAVVLYGNASPAKAVATVHLNGIGVEPQAVFSPSVISGLGSYGDSMGLAVGGGSLYVADQIDSGVWVLPPGCISNACARWLGGDFRYPLGVAVDGAGNVYVADTGNHTVKEMPNGCASSACELTLAGSWDYPGAVAVDGNGDVYVAEVYEGAIKELPAGCSALACVKSLGGGFHYPQGVAVDGGGNVYVGDSGNNAVKQIPAGCASAACVKTLGSGFSSPSGVAVDGSENIYVADYGVSHVREIPAGCTTSACVLDLGSSFHNPTGVAVDGGGNVFVDDYLNDTVDEIHRAGPPSLTFASTVVGSTSTDSPQTVTVNNIGNADLNILGVVYPTDFPEAAGVSTDCTMSTSLAAGDSCTLSTEFSPLASSSPRPSTPLSETISLTDNNLNGSAVKQSVAVNGTATGLLPVLTSPKPGGKLSSSRATFRWTPASWPTDYLLKLSTTHYGGSDVFGGITSATSILVSGIPTQVATLYATLSYKINGNWTPIKYTFTEAPWDPPAITTPVPGNTLPVSSVTFNWTPGAGPTEYRLRMGTTGPGSSNIYLGPGTTSLSATVSGLPTNGQPVYVTLGYKVNGVWHAVPYTYTAQ